MGSFSLNYLLRRLLVFFLTLWVAATLMFIIPRLAPGDPISAMIARMSQFEGFVENADLIIESWRKRFGLDDPLHLQYLRYLENLLRLDLGYSMMNFPSTVSELVGRAMPWTIGLVGIATVIFFTVGNLCGALLAWYRTPKLLRLLIPISMSFTSVPPALLSLLLVYIFGSKLNLFPLVDSYGRGMVPKFTLEFIGSVLHHGFLPAMSIVLATFGFWALGMRGMMVTIEGEDYMILAQAKGLKPFYVLYRYMVRNAILPQMTALAVSIGTLINGSVLVEYMFTYKGMGSLIYAGISNQDFGLIQGTSFILIVTSALAVLIIDLTYPLIDPRISLEGR
ncbi:MAG: ABC transporter permease [Chloroflexota bacterium]|nr:ABC transporter permease [Chloroflexota bacterium]